MSVAGGPDIITNGLVLFLDAGDPKSYPGAGTTCKDLSSNGYIGTLDGVTYNSAYNGTFLFDGTNDIIDTNFPAQTINYPTLEAWIYETKINNGYKSIIQINTNADDALYLNGSNDLMFWPCWSSLLNVPSEKWFHVSVSFDGTSLLYSVNGQFKIQTNGCSDITNFEYIRIGGFATYDAELFKGNIALVRVYNRNLSPTEILQNYNATKSRFGL